MSQWYLSYDGKQIGPMDHAQAVAQARSNPNGFAWRQGFGNWMPISQVPELSAAGAPSPPPPAAARGADVIDYQIMGAEMQFVEVELDPGESAVAEAGAMMYKDAPVEMQTIFGDGSTSGEGGGFLDKLIGAGKRLITGESLFMTVFTHTGQGKAHVAFGAPYPGNIIPVALTDVGGTLVCQKDSFLCAAKGVSIGIYFQKKILTGLFGGEGFIMQKLEGDGLVFLHAGGTVVERTLGAGEVLHVDTGCIVAFQPSVDFDIVQAGGIKTALFGGEGFFFATLRGPGRIWLQSLPFSRLAGRMLEAAPQKGGSQGEGSILGALGNFIDGDN
ncbi:MAG: TIGR00266 family protein [Deltaproteobacteria bacterium]|nr:TIGR00266 family protein [Deltaproteobacteria bacterium]MBW2127753.1 TIGR00266 family protein [Deltaproteobacteria bacterium]MBW2303189.1 TIGR00266 family protein [Deltaproteobacteria bacterium]